MFTITKEFAFSAAHHLHGLPDGHQCSRDHGHNYVVTVELASSELHPPGFVMDYGDMAPLKQYVDDALDHHNLNDLLPFNPTAENLCRWLFDLCQSWGWPVSGVGVSETPKTHAWYRP